MVEYVHTPVSVGGQRGAVIGGTGGLGQAIALGFASEGADLLVTSPTDSFEETAAAIEATGVDTAGVTGDLTEQDSIDAVSGAAVDAFGGVDVVASQDAISREALLDISGDELDFVTEVALQAVRRPRAVGPPALTSQARSPGRRTARAARSLRSWRRRRRATRVRATPGCRGGVPRPSPWAPPRRPGGGARPGRSWRH